MNAAMQNRFILLISALKKFLHFSERAVQLAVSDSKQHCLVLSHSFHNKVVYSALVSLI
jgi:hypothetical protein